MIVLAANQDWTREHASPVSVHFPELQAELKLKSFSTTHYASLYGVVSRVPENGLLSNAALLQKASVMTV